jgi:hypothetical protein
LGELEMVLGLFFREVVRRPDDAFDKYRPPIFRQASELVNSALPRR